MNLSGCCSKFSSGTRSVTVVGLAASLLLAGCGTSRIVDRSGSGQDAAPLNPPVNIDTITDAVPQPEPLSSTGNSPYKVFGVRYVPMQQSRGYSETGVASWYGTKFHGRKTSSGEEYDMFGMTAAHTTLPLPTYAKVQNLENGRTIVVKVNDRGPFANDRLIDLSYVAAYKLGMVEKGTAQVRVTAIDTGKNFASDSTRNRPIVAGYSNPSTTGPVVAESIYPGPAPAGAEINYGQVAGAAASTYNNASQAVTTQGAYGQAAGTAVSTYNTGVQTAAGQTGYSQSTYNQTTALPSAGGVTTYNATGATGTATGASAYQTSTYNTTSAQTGYQTQPVATTASTTYQATPGYTVWQSGSGTYQSTATTPNVTNPQMPPLNPSTQSQTAYNTGTVQYQTQTEPAWQTYQSGQTTQTATYQSAQSVDYASNAPVPPSPYTPPAQTQAGGIYVQVGAFSDRTNADKVQAALQQRGFTPVNVMPVARAAGTLYRVRIGPMLDYALADAELARLTNSISFGGRPRVVVE